MSQKTLKKLIRKILESSFGDKTWLATLPLEED